MKQFFEVFIIAVFIFQGLEALENNKIFFEIEINAEDSEIRGKLKSWYSREIYKNFSAGVVSLEMTNLMMDQNSHSDSRIYIKTKVNNDIKTNWALKMEKILNNGEKSFSTILRYESYEDLMTYGSLNIIAFIKKGHFQSTLVYGIKSDDDLKESLSNKSAEELEKLYPIDQVYKTDPFPVVKKRVSDTNLITYKKEENNTQLEEDLEEIGSSKNGTASFGGTDKDVIETNTHQSFYERTKDKKEKKKSKRSLGVHFTPNPGTLALELKKNNFTSFFSGSFIMPFAGEINFFSGAGGTFPLSDQRYFDILFVLGMNVFLDNLYQDRYISEDDYVFNKNINPELIADPNTLALSAGITLGYHRDFNSRLYLSLKIPIIGLSIIDYQYTTSINVRIFYLSFLKAAPVLGVGCRF